MSKGQAIARMRMAVRNSKIPVRFSCGFGTQKPSTYQPQSENSSAIDQTYRFSFLLTFVFNIKRTPAAAITITSLDDANLVRHVQGVVVGRQPHVRLLLSVGPEI